MKLTKQDKLTIAAALKTAIDYEESVIDAHRIVYDESKGSQAYMHPKVVPKEYKSVEKSSLQRIKRYENLITKLRPDTTIGGAK